VNLKEGEDCYNTRLRSGFHFEFCRGDSFKKYYE